MLKTILIIIISVTIFGIILFVFVRNFMKKKIEYYLKLNEKKKIKISNKEPLYVIDIIAKTNSIIVGPQDFLNIKKLFLRDINLLSDKKIFKDDIFIKVRSTGKLLKAKATIKENNANVEILQNEKGISPGQACVFYSKDNFGDRLLGGGWIDKVFNKNLSTQLTDQ
tara:strand:- start:931 stop:1431 length:501 start_codon:yes stop_codon:yes gene_type:complete